MEKFYSKVEEGLIAHAIYRFSEFQGRQNIVSESEFLQIATLKLSKMETFEAHIHLWKDLPKNKNVAQESWIVVKGEVEVNFFDIDGEFLHQDVLHEGDCSISLYGGHSYTALSESMVYEFKNGPYLGQLKDKKFVKDLL